MKISKRRLLLLGIDIICYWLIVTGLYLGSLILPYGTLIVSDYFIGSALLFTLVFSCRILSGTYQTVWRYTSTLFYFKIIISDIIGSLLMLAVNALLSLSYGFWSILLIASLNALIALSARFSYRLLYKFINRGPKSYEINVAIIGAGELGNFLVNELSLNPRSLYKPVCFIDSDKNKIGATMAGLKILSPQQFALRRDSFEISEVIIAIGFLSDERLQEMNEIYSGMGYKVNLYALPIRETGLSEGKRVIREFQIEDLLFRDPLKVASDETRAYYADKTVLVTGGGGSIGSELSRQIAKCAPKKLIIFDIYENNAYTIQQELIRLYGDALDLAVEIGSVRDPKRLDTVFSRYRPDIIFHAAAHKHVPLMEDSPAEAIKNNILGTYNTANAAERYGVQKFILISTDKAVNPTNIMGASKRFCEMIIQCREDSKTAFAAVRFGNVLGSNGSVIPLFKEQIASGGPITITDKRIIRYFMTIPEASQLVMTAGAMAKKGELFVLDMGKPVKIYDLAVNMIRLSGLRPEEDIKIEEIGLRRGEKLYEELLMQTETLDKTDNDMIFIEKDTPYTRQEIDRKIALLQEAVIAYENGELTRVKAALKEQVPTFREPEEINSTAQNADEMKQAE